MHPVLRIRRIPFRRYVARGPLTSQLRSQSSGLSDTWSCWCSTQLRQSPPPASISQSGCDSSCPNNALESCGGQQRLNIYTNDAPFVDPAPVRGASPDWIVLGCMADVYRPFVSSVYTAPQGESMNMKLCTRQCGQGGMDISGTAYASVYNVDYCSCDAELGPNVAPAPLELCLSPCKGQLLGAPKEACGGDGREGDYALVYKRVVVNDMSTTASTATVPSTTATSKIEIAATETSTTLSATTSLFPTETPDNHHNVPAIPETYLISEPRRPAPTLRRKQSIAPSHPT
ncbi:hypothetical protein PMIN07_012003 [Paraphaeosphaeria minitans]